MAVARNTRNRRVSAHGRAFIRREEGCVLHPYNDSAGHATIGVGHLLHHGNVTAADRQRYAHFTTASADRLLASDLHTFESGVNRLVTAKLSQAEFDALVSFAFNIGV